MTATSSILVTGGSGYLGQFVVKDAAAVGKVVCVYQSSKPEGTPEGVELVQCDLTDADAVKDLFATHGPFTAVINTAAISQTNICQTRPDFARSVNVPSALLTVLEAEAAAGRPRPLLVQLSTDQVYDGTKARWAEGDHLGPMNVYSTTKVEAEGAIRERWPLHVILRSSLIIGPQPSCPVSRPLFLQFIEGALRKGDSVQFFTDEYRSPVYAQDCSKAAVWAAQLATSGASAEELEAQYCGVYNCGGPDRLNRWEMATKVSKHCGLSMDCASACLAADLMEVAPRPLDISMDNSKLYEKIPFKFMTFEEGLESTFGPAAKQ